jgi:DnaJ-domain-containing protein 1
MDQIFDRLGNLLKSTLRSDTNETVRNTSYSDPDLQDAWDELNDFLKNDDDTPRGSGPSFTESTFTRPSSIPQSVTDAYELLGVSPATSTIDIAKAYKTLLLKHHPDRVASDASKVASATEKTKLINRAFQDIKAYRAANA